MLQFLNIEGSLFTFCFGPCVPLFILRTTQMSATSLILCRLLCFLFERVALPLLSVPLCFEPKLFLPSSCFVQRAGAFHLSFVFIVIHTLFSMILGLFCVLRASKSCPYILPCFPNFPHGVCPPGFGVAFTYVLSLRLFFFVKLFHDVPS